MNKIPFSSYTGFYKYPVKIVNLEMENEKSAYEKEFEITRYLEFKI